MGPYLLPIEYGTTDDNYFKLIRWFLCIHLNALNFFAIYEYNREKHIL